MEANEEIKQLSFNLFETFSRMEYALKAAGYWRLNKIKAEADWDRFTAGIAASFSPDQSPEIKSACDYILSQPPNKQMIKDGVIKWLPALEEGDEAKKLSVYIRRVRNNLFHGGKYGDLGVNQERNRALLVHSLTILRYIKTLHTEVADHCEH